MADPQSESVATEGVFYRTDTSYYELRMALYLVPYCASVSSGRSGLVSDRFGIADRHAQTVVAPSARNRSLPAYAGHRRA
jgi:hypothetical protein